jgi:hypothetical protein
MICAHLMQRLLLKLYLHHKAGPSCHPRIKSRLKSCWAKTKEIVMTSDDMKQNLEELAERLGVLRGHL